MLDSDLGFTFVLKAFDHVVSSSHLPGGRRIEVSKSAGPSERSERKKKAG
jgi:hypothetical protein